MRNITQKALNVLLPARCISCEGFIEDPRKLCGACWQKIDFISNPKCIKCGFPFPYDDSTEDSLCGACIANPPLYKKLSSVLIYNDNSQHLIHQFKYTDRVHAAGTYASWMLKEIDNIISDVDIIIPVPLHPMRLFTRRYNQAALLSNAMAKQSGIKSIPDALKRVRHTPPQAKLGKNKRKGNVLNAFSINMKYIDKIRNKSVLIVDDVVTTGATINECTKILNKGGARDVYIITLAKRVR